MSAYRHVAGFGLSASVHVLAGGAAIWFGAPERAPIASATSIRAFIVAPTEDAEFLGLNPIDRAPIDGMVGDASEAAAFTVGDLRVEFANARAVVMSKSVSRLAATGLLMLFTSVGSVLQGQAPGPGPDITIYILTSNRTFSAAEDFTYGLK